MEVEIDGIGPMQRIQNTDIFECMLDAALSARLPQHYRLNWTDKADSRQYSAVSPYSFAPLLADLDLDRGFFRTLTKGLCLFIGVAVALNILGLQAVAVSLLAGGGMLKLVNQTVPMALERLGYSPDELRGLRIVDVEEHAGLLRYRCEDVDGEVSNVLGDAVVAAVHQGPRLRGFFLRLLRAALRLRLAHGGRLGLFAGPARVLGLRLGDQPRLLRFEAGAFRFQLAGTYQQIVAFLVQANVLVLELGALGHHPRDLDAAVGHVDQVDAVGVVARPGFRRAQGTLGFAQRQRRVTRQLVVGFQLVELGADLLERQVFLRRRGAGGEQAGSDDGNYRGLHFHCRPSP